VYFDNFLAPHFAHQECNKYNYQKYTDQGSPGTGFEYVANYIAATKRKSKHCEKREEKRTNVFHRKSGKGEESRHKAGMFIILAWLTKG
jgi:hypothetical protein